MVAALCAGRGDPGEPCGDEIARFIGAARRLAEAKVEDVDLGIPDCSDGELGNGEDTVRVLS